VRAVRSFSTVGDFPQTARYYRFLECLARFSEPRVRAVRLDWQVNWLMRAQFEQWIAKFYGWFESEEAVFVATEYFEHGDLAAYMENHARLIEDDAAHITAQVLEGLTFVHDLGFAHRNIKLEVRLSVLVRAITDDPDGPHRILRRYGRLEGQNRRLRH
jgi:serine/threonine protein kinase